MRRTACFLHRTQRVGYLVAGEPPHDSSRLDELISMAIVQANVAPLMRDGALSQTYAQFGTTPPDDLRRPVSIRSISSSLRLSHETTRRRIRRMEEQGLCVVTPDGVYVPQSVLASDKYVAGSLRVVDELRDLYFELRGIGALDAPRPLSAPSPSLPLRAFMRRSGDYFLRVIDGITRLVGVMPMLVLLALLNEAAAAGRPLALKRLAEQVRLPKESVRRNAMALVGLGYCERTADGYRVAPDLLERPEWTALCQSNLADLRRFYADAEALGVVGGWTASSPPSPASPSQSETPDPFSAGDYSG